MKHKEDRPLKKTTIYLYEDAIAKLDEYHGSIGASTVIRMLIDKHLKRVENTIAQRGRRDGNQEA